MSGAARRVRARPARRPRSAAPVVPPPRGSSATCGQAAVELVALLPLVVVVALAVLQALAAGLAAELADHAAHSGAVALAQGRDGVAAAREAVPGWARGRLEVELHGRRVRVRMTPPALLPGVAERLAATASADAGPAS